MSEFERLGILFGISGLISKLMIGDFAVAMLVVGVAGYVAIKTYNFFFEKDESFNG